jgi:hypothetical protein
MMRIQKPIIVSAFLLALGVWLSMSLNPTAFAQAEPTPTPSAYGELLDTEIRGLSPDAIETYRTGTGGGLVVRSLRF